MKTIIAPIDFSPATNAVLTAAVKLARTLHARLEIVHAVPALPTAPRYQAIAEDLATLAVEDRRNATARLHDARKATVAQYPHVSTHLLTGDAATAIADYTRRQNADYLVVGSNGHGAVYDLIVGSTTQALLKRSPCPVVSVPTPRDAAPFEPALRTAAPERKRFTPRRAGLSLLFSEE